MRPLVHRDPEVPGVAGAAGLSQGWLACSAAESIAGAATDIVDGAWQHHKVKFNYVGFTTLYTCDGLEDRVGEILRRNRAVGFNTYGEQFCGVHVNQTLTGIALGAGPTAAADA